MSLFVKHTEIALVGIKASADVIQRVSGLTDDGLPILGEVELMQETPQLEIRDGQIMYATEDGDTYPASMVVDWRENGDVIAAHQLEQDRPLTQNIRAVWRAEVAGRRTEQSLKEWTDDLSDGEWLKFHGLYLGERDMRINEDFEGAWQVTENYDAGEDLSAGNGPWAIVGNDTVALCREAINEVRSRFA